MDLVRKWWWLVLLGVAIGLGIVYFRNLISTINQRKSVGQTVVTSGKAQMAVGGKQVTVEKQVTAEVVSWDSNKAELTFKIVENTGSVKITVDSGQMGIFIPEAQHKTNGVLPVKNGDVNWKSAFCPNDGLTVGYDSSGIVRMLFNTGYRMCGLKSQ